MTERFAQCACGDRRDCGITRAVDIIHNIAATSIRLIGYHSGLLDPIRIGIAEIYR